ncbi:MAG: hypothetical protein COB02_11380 [Candidatus Cloacimonadota bacterium]|nr:MAG: hypothetical protein COB02_11380 [Candidatus Cloacimonadota bacterium]
MNIPTCLLLSFFVLISFIIFTLIASSLNIKVFKKVDKYFEWTQGINLFLISSSIKKIKI